MPSTRYLFVFVAEKLVMFRFRLASMCLEGPVQLIV